MGVPTGECPGLQERAVCAMRGVSWAFFYCYSAWSPPWVVHCCTLSLCYLCAEMIITETQISIKRSSSWATNYTMGTHYNLPSQVPGAARRPWGHSRLLWVAPQMGFLLQLSLSLTCALRLFLSTDKILHAELGSYHCSENLQLKSFNRWSNFKLWLWIAIWKVWPNILGSAEKGNLPWSALCTLAGRSRSRQISEL